MNQMLSQEEFSQNNDLLSSGFGAGDAFDGANESQAQEEGHAENQS